MLQKPPASPNSAKMESVGNRSRLPTGKSSSKRGKRPGTGKRPTSAAIQQVSAVNNAMAQINVVNPNSSIHLRQTSTKSGRSTSPATSYGRALSAASRRPKEHAFHAWTAKPPSTCTSRRESVDYFDGAGAHQSTSAWTAFENSIKEIADDTLYFSQQHHRNVHFSEAFKQVLTDINYTPQLEDTAKDDDDISLLSYHQGSIAGTADGSTVDVDSTEQQCTDDDCASMSRNSAYGRKSPGVHFPRERGDGAAPTTLTGRLSPAEEEPDGLVMNPKKGTNFIQVADLHADPKEVRSELYNRYLKHPEMWTVGLTRHLNKTVTKERVPTSKAWKTTQIFRPKSATVNGSRFDNSGAKCKRVQSAHNFPKIGTPGSNVFRHNGSTTNNLWTS